MTRPRVFIPTLYFIEGLPYTVVRVMSIPLLKNLQTTNELNSMITSLLSLPWTLKPLWAPFIDLCGTRRSWILVAHAVLAGLCSLLALGLLSPFALPLAVVMLVLIGFTSATQDIAIDGFYMDVLDQGSQSLYVGVRNTAYQVSLLTGQGILVSLAGAIGEHSSGGFKLGWAIAFGLCSILLGAAFAFHSFALPKPQEAHAHEIKAATGIAMVRDQFWEVFKTFFTQEHIGVIVAYIILFRLGEAMLRQMAQLFLMDPVSQGGLGIPLSTLGIIYGTVGTIALLLGGICGSLIVARFGLRKWLLPSALIQNSSILLYWALSVFKPGLAIITLVCSFEQFAYGMGSAAYTVYLLSTVKPEYKAAHYAIATGLMAFGLLIPQYFSGRLTTHLGYPSFFLLSFTLAVPGIITIFLLPFRNGAK